MPKSINMMMLSHHLSRKSVALVLAGGKGTRLKGLTAKRAKPAVHFGGKFRLIDFSLSNCLNSGIRRIGVITQYQSHSLVRHIQKGWSFFNKEMNEFIDLLPAQQRKMGDNWYQGTADAIYQNLEIVQGYGADYVIILAGDHIYKMDYSRMLLDHVQNKAKFTVACIATPLKEASQFGIMEIDEQRWIVSFVEKPSEPSPLKDKPEYSLASMGIYIFNSHYLYQMLKEDHADIQSSHDFGKDIIPKIVAKGEAFAHPFEYSCISSDPAALPYWRDIGTLSAYWSAALDLVSETPKFDMFDKNWPIRTYVEWLPPAKFTQDSLGNHAITINSLIADGAIISASMIKRSILFPHVKVDSCCTVEETVLLPRVHVGHACRLRHCIIDCDCIIPDGMVVGEDAEEDNRRFHRTEDGVTLVTQEMLNLLY